jgi:peptide/nickel transport system permease protein
MTDSTSTPVIKDNASMPSMRSLSPMALATRRFRKHRMAMFGLGLLFLLVLYVSVVGWFSNGYCAPISQMTYGEAWANCNDTSLKLQPPSADRIFGTDVIGRDIFARTVYGGQISLLIGISAAIVEVFLGALVGAVAAYYGGWVDNLLMRFTEAMLNIPSLFLLIIGARFFGGGLPPFNFFGRELTGSVLVIILIIGATSLPIFCRTPRRRL